MAVMSCRENLEFEGEIQSDTAPLHKLVQAMLEASDQIHCCRDPTRGGLATTLNEMASRSAIGIERDEVAIPVSEFVQGACEIPRLGPDFIMASAP